MSPWQATNTVLENSSLPPSPRRDFNAGPAVVAVFPLPLHCLHLGVGDTTPVSLAAAGGRFPACALGALGLREAGLDREEAGGGGGMQPHPSPDFTSWVLETEAEVARPDPPASPTLWGATIRQWRSFENSSSN